MPTVDPLAEFEEFGRSAPRLCVVARRQAELEPEDREKLEAALDAPHIGAAAIQKWFRARGIRIDDKTITLHRNAECCCV